MSNPITLTPRAVDHIKATFAYQGKEGHALRMGVKGGGCSGFNYVMAPVAEPEPGDQVFDCDGLTVCVDLKSFLYLAGMEIDYSDDLLDGGFKFRNPNATHSCGCGTSFSV
jgi:iron-sulfur cluster assembly protein